MTRLRLILIVALFCVAVPAALAVPPAGKGKPEKSQASGQGAEKNAAKAACRAERANDPAAFKAKYGKNPNKANAGKCVSKKAKKDKNKSSEEEADDTEAESDAESNAAKRCKAERTLIGVQAFNNLHGTNHNKRNAFGKCVSKLAKAQGSSS